MTQQKDLPPTPEDAPTLFQCEGNWYAAHVDPGCPAVTTGHPDTWEPGEPRCMDRLYVYLLDDWVPLMELGLHSEDMLWDALACVQHESW